MRSGGQVNPSNSPPPAPPPTPTEIEQEIQELEELREEKLQELAELKAQRERLIAMNTRQILVADAMRNAEEAQSDADEPPVDEFDEKSIHDKQAYSMADAMSYRALVESREIAGPLAMEVLRLEGEIDGINRQLEALRNPNQTT